MREESSTTKPASIRCRPQPGYWVMVLLFGGMGIFTFCLSFTSSPPNSPLEKYLFYGIVAPAWLVPALWGAAWLIRATIIADESGLRWRSVGRWRQANWQEVQDYYDEFRLNPQHAKAIIETTAGSIRLSENNYRDVPLLRDLVQTQAHWARTRQWDVKGLRREIDWPYVFRYRPQGQQKTHLILLIICAFWVGSGLWWLLANRQIFLDVWAYAGVVMMFLGLILYLAFLSAAPLVAKIVFSIDNEIYRRRHETITLSAMELVFENSRERRAIPWHEIKDYYSDPMHSRQSFDDRFVVVGQKASFDFTIIQERFLLIHLISQLATNAPYRQWREYRPVQKPKEQSFDYRNRYCRMVLGIINFYCLLPLIPVISSPSPEMIEHRLASSTLELWIVGVLAGLICLVLWRSYYVGRISISEEGIGQQGLWSTKFLLWEEINELRPGSFYRYQVVGQNSNVVFSALITNLSILKDEIQRRAINAEIHPSWNRTTT